MTIHSSPIGLDGVVAAATALSHVDGERGELIIAGQRVGDLAASESFEGVTARLWTLAGRTIDEAAVRGLLGEARTRAFERLPSILRATAGMSIIGGFRAAVAALRPEEGLPDEAVLVGSMPVLAAALARQSRGEAPIAPDPQAGHAADTLRMLRGQPVTKAEARALDTYYITVSDHGMNASTFAARVVASTQADLFMAITAAYCALTGPLHGGAPEPVLDMLNRIGNLECIKPWIDAALARGDRLMGFGHRIYRVRDPRADVLRGAVTKLGSGSTDLGLAAEVTPDGACEARAVEIAALVARHSARALSLAKDAVRAADELPLSAGLERERRNIALAFTTRDQKEGMAAFFEKRPPRFHDE
mgnify:CR=1 FL=1